TRRRRALIAAKRRVANGWANAGRECMFCSVSSGPRLARPAKCWHYFSREQVLRLDRFPVLQAAKVGDDGQFADPALFLQSLDFRDHLLWRPDKANFLVDDFFVRKLGERLERAAGIKTIALGAQLSFLSFALKRFHRGSIECQEIKQCLFHLFAN